MRYTKNFWEQMKKSYVACFVGSILFTMAIYLLLGLVSGGHGLLQVFFRETADLFMDFFNSIRDASQGIASYTERKVIYPPMANLIFFGLSLLVPADYTATDFEDRKSWIDYPACWALILCFIVISAVLFGLLIYKGIRGERRMRGWLAFAAVFSVPFLNMMERGNLMSLAFLSLLVFAVTYDSKSAVVREIGILALAFSFSIKLYPILFAWLLFADRRYKEFFRCALYSVALLILPSFFFGGPICLVWILQNIFSFSGSGGAGGVVGLVSKYTHIPELLLTLLLYTPFILSTLSFIVAPFVCRDRWKVWALGCTMFVAYPALSSTYAWALFIIPILYLYKSGQELDWYETKGKKGYLTAMLIPFLFLGIPLAFIPGLHLIFVRTGPVLSFNALTVYVCTVILSIWGTVDTVRILRDGCQAKRKSSS